MQLPLKARILDYAINCGKTFVVDDVMKALDGEYKGERLFHLKQIEEYIDSYLGVGFLTAKRTEFDETGKLLVHCSITEYGKTRKKYLK